MARRRNAQDELARHIHFACSMCHDRLHLTGFPNKDEFNLKCPICKRSGHYNLNVMLDEALEDAVRSSSFRELDAVRSRHARSRAARVRHHRSHLQTRRFFSARTPTSACPAPTRGGRARSST